MVVDHVATILFPGTTWMNIIGRVSFPLFAWLIALGYTRTRNVDRYIFRLFILALISQIPYDLAFDDHQLNIFITLFIGLLGIDLWQRIGATTLSISPYIKNVFRFSVIAAFATIANQLHAAYGGWGVLLIVSMYVLRNHFRALCFWIIISTLFESISFGRENGTPYMEYGIGIYSITCIFFIYLYSGAPGKKLSKLWYFFYPAHLLLLVAIQYLWFQ